MQRNKRVSPRTGSLPYLDRFHWPSSGHDEGIHGCSIARKARDVRDVASIFEEEWRNSAAREYLWAKFHLVPSLTRGGVPVTRKEESVEGGGDNRARKFESRKFAALDLVWKDLEGE